MLGVNGITWWLNGDVVLFSEALLINLELNSLSNDLKLARLI